MSRATRSVTSLAILPLLFAFGCAGTGASTDPELPQPARSVDSRPPELTGGDASGEAMSPPDSTGQGASFERVLDRTLERGGEWQDLRIETECLQDDAFRQVVIFGSGVAIWNERRQIALDPADLIAILDAIRRGGLSSMLDLYGRGQKELEPPESRKAAAAADEGSAMRIICRVSVTLDGVTKQAAQRAQGPQFAPLRELAEEILALAHEPEEEGVVASDLADGLAKVAAGRLAPEAMTLVLNRKEEDVEAGTPEAPRDAGYLLRVDGRRLSVRPFRKPGGYGDPVGRELDAAAVAELAELLTANGVGDLPPNLYSGHYSDLVVVVLNRDVRVQARGFANMNPKTHAEAQERFERIEEGLDALAREALLEES